MATNLRSQIATLWIKVDGAEIEPGELAHVVDVTIDQDLVLPDAFAIRLRDIVDRPGQQEQRNFPLLDGDRFPVGSTIQIGLGHEQRAQPVFKGEITSLELDAQGDGNPIFTVRGYDLAYRLHRQRKSRTFLNVSDGDIVAQVAREYGLSVQVDNIGTHHAHLYQDNQTDWEFVRKLANQSGCELFIDMDHKALVFRRPSATATAPQQEFGNNLLRVRLRMSAPSQVEEVVVRGWDPDAKHDIEGRARAPRSRAQLSGDRLRSQLARRLGGGSLVVTNQPVRSAAEADALAQSLYDEMAGEFVQLDCTCLGDWQLRPGQSIQFKNLGHRFDHDYYVSAVTHKITAGGYVTHFAVGGRRPKTLTSLLATNAGGSLGGHESHEGVVVGLVTNNKDDNYGRVKVTFPWLGTEESQWARIVAPMAGNGRGIMFLPEVGDEVLVAFKDVNCPYVLGGLWNGRDKPPKDATDVVGPTGKVNQRILKSRLGHTITLDDSDEQPSITIVDKTGNNSVKLDSSTNSFTATVQGDIRLEARGHVAITGTQVSLESLGPLTITGATTSVQAAASLTLAGATVNLS
jgi:uncharacterized protein involved in type VI secretion and phage assembly